MASIGTGQGNLIRSHGLVPTDWESPHYGTPERRRCSLQGNRSALGVGWRAAADRSPAAARAEFQGGCLCRGRMKIQEQTEG